MTVKLSGPVETWWRDRTARPNRGPLVAAFTELELTVLGLVGQHGPCTAYEVMRLFQQSPTSSFRASSGAIYPLVKKLVRLGLLSTRQPGPWAKGADAEPGAGLATALVAWLRDMPDELGDPTSDPLRSRLMFLGDLPAEERRAFVARGLALTEQSIANLSEAMAGLPADSPFEQAAHAVRCANSRPGAIGCESLPQTRWTANDLGFRYYETQYRTKPCRC